MAGAWKLQPCKAYVAATGESRLHKRGCFMRIRATGKIAEGFWHLGNRETSSYALQGRNGTMLINGGFSFSVPDVLGQLEKWQIDPAGIDKYLILHSHPDHVGMVPYFKKRYPGMIIYASSRAKQILSSPRAIDAINEAGRYSAQMAGKSSVYTDFDLEWHPEIQVEALNDGDLIDLGGMAVMVLETPGHSSCSISAL